MTNEHSFVEPLDYCEVAENLISKNIIEEKLKNTDIFTFGKNITSAGNQNDETAKDYIEERALGAHDLREKISKFENKHANFVFVIEAHNGNGIQLGSGVLVNLGTTLNKYGAAKTFSKFALTAAHVVTHNSAGAVQKVTHFKFKIKKIV